MFAFPYTESARDNFFEASLIGGAGFLFSTLHLYFQLFKRRAFLCFIDWDARFSNRLGIPRSWTNRWKIFAQSWAYTIFWSVLVVLMSVLFRISVFCYLIEVHHLHHAVPYH